MVREQIEIRSFQATDLKGVAELYAERKPRVDLRKYQQTLRNHLLNNPRGEAFGVVGMRGGRVVGCNFRLPVDMLVQGQVTRCWIPHGLCVSPRVSDPLLGYRLARSVSRDYQGSLYFGFPTTESISLHSRALLKSGARLHTSRHLAICRYPLCPSVVLRPLGKKFPLPQFLSLVGRGVGLLGGIRDTPASSGELTILQQAVPSEDFDDLWLSAANQRQTLLVRDRSYLEWRFSAQESDYLYFEARKGGALVGYFVLEERRAVMELSDIFCLTTDGLYPELFFKACEIARIRGKRSLSFLVNMAAPDAREILQFGNFQVVQYITKLLAADETVNDEQWSASVEVPNWYAALAEVRSF